MSDIGELEDWLLDRGIDPAEIGEALRLVERISTAKASVALRDILTRLDGNPAAVALRRVVLGTAGVPLREAAIEAGCSFQNLHRKESKIRRRLSGGGDKLCP